MNKIIISYIPSYDVNIQILKSIESTLLVANQMTDCSDFNIIYNMYQDIVMSSSYSINADDFLQDRIDYIGDDEKDILNHLKSNLRLNKNPIIFVGFNDLNMETVKKMCPIIKDKDNIVINILIEKKDEKLNTISSHVIDIDSVDIELNWEEISNRIKEEYKANLNREENEYSIVVSEELERFLKATQKGNIEKSIGPFTLNLDINLEDLNWEKEMDIESIKTISFINKNGCLALDKISDDLACISDDEGNKILLDEESIKFLIDNLKNLL